MTLYKEFPEGLLDAGAHIISKDIVTVNGSDILHMKFAEERNSTKLIGMSYAYSNKTGMVFIMAVTTARTFAEHESDILHLFNGFVDPKSKIQPIKSDDDIESKLIKLKNLMDKGLITQEDYDKQKSKLLNSHF